MENLLKDKEIWILGSVCLVATFLWGRLWKLFSAKKRGRTTASADTQTSIPHGKALASGLIIISDFGKKTLKYLSPAMLVLSVGGLVSAFTPRIGAVFLVM